MVIFIKKVQALSRKSKSFILMLIDFFLVTLAVAISKLITTDSFELGEFYLFIVPALFVFFLFLSGFYKYIFSETDISLILNKLLIASFLSNTTLIFILNNGMINFVISFSLSILFIIFYRSYFKNYLINNKYEKTIGIYGAGAAGNMLYSALTKSLEYKVCFFIDDDKSLIGRSSGGIPIISIQDAESYVLKTGVKEIALAIPSISDNKKIGIINSLSILGLKITKVPPLEDIILGKKSVDSLSEFTINDLLGRDLINPKKNLLNKSVSSDDTILITGAGGSIGSELCVQISKLNPKKLVLLDISEHSLYEIERKLLTNACKCEIEVICGSILDDNLLQSIHEKHRINFIFHAAAYKHVPMVEKNILQAIQNNVLGTQKLVEYAQRFNIKKFVLISTDKAVRPTNIMGATKRLCEIILQSQNSQNKKNSKNKTIYSMVRFGNVLGSSGSVVPLFREQIKTGGPITLTHKEISRYFMSIPEAVGLVIQSTTLASGGDVFVLDMGEPIKIHDLAKLMIKLSGKTLKDANNDGDIEIKITGLRKGEKLYEELLIGDNVSNTSHEKIMCARETFLDYEKTRDVINELRVAINDNNEKDALKILYENIEDFNHNIPT